MKRKAGRHGSKKAGASKARASKSFAKKGANAAKGTAKRRAKSVRKVKGVARKSIGRGYNPQGGGFSSQRKSRMFREAKERAAAKRRDARAVKYEADGMSPEAAMARAQKELWKD